MKKSGDVTQSHLLIELAGETYAMNIANVYQIFEVQTITRVPQMPEFMLGIMNARGRMLPVIDMRKLYSIEAAMLSKQSSIIAASSCFGDSQNGEKQDVGLLVDAVLEVVDIDESKIERPTLPGSADGYSCFSGFVRLSDKIVMILDVEHLMDTDNMAQVRSFVTANATV